MLIMKIGIISDIHANLHALQAVISDMEKEQIEEVWCLGDIINYGAFPNECCSWVMNNCSVSILGNHELMLLGYAEVDSPVVNECLNWTKKTISPRWIEYIKTLPLVYKNQNISIVHDNPLTPGSMIYILDNATATKSLLKQETDICFFGHTHIPIGYKLSSIGAETIKISYFSVKEGRFLINPGSVGQPRDNNPKASYGIYDSEEKNIKIKRIEYDVKAAAKSILEAGLPPIMAARLIKGI